MADPWESVRLPFDEWVQSSVDSLMPAMRPFFQAAKLPLQFALDGMQAALVSTSPWVVLSVLLILAWQVAGVRVAMFAVLSMTVIGVIGVWHETMMTLAVILTAVFFCLLAGIPIGIIAARSDRFDTAIRPVLDVMQTLPAFVYMVPVVMLLGIGNVPGVAVTAVFALPPVIRLTNLGLREVPRSMIEAAYAFGSSPAQVLFKIQFPLAIRTIMAGINQTLMMALAMVVIASMIAVDGLGMLVLRGIGRLDVGLATSGGVGIVLLAMVLDRLTQALGPARRHETKWTRRGPVGLLWRLFSAPNAGYGTANANSFSDRDDRNPLDIEEDRMNKGTNNPTVLKPEEAK